MDKTYKGFTNYETWWAWWAWFDNDGNELRAYKRWKETSPDITFADYLYETYYAEISEAFEDNKMGYIISSLTEMGFKRIDWEEVADEVIKNAEADLADGITVNTDAELAELAKMIEADMAKSAEQEA